MTLILVYAATGHGEEERKRQRALDVLEEAEFGTSGQVLQEFLVTVTRKVKRPLSALAAAEWMDRVALRPVIPIDADLVKLAVRTSGWYQISHWHAAIIAAAQSLEAPVLYTEDLNSGQTFGSVRAVNPFV